MRFAQLTTEKGSALPDVASTIQKAIRRGDEDTALYFAVELYNSKYDEYLWRRLRVISSEDIGMAEPLMPGTIQALYSAYVDFKKKRTDNQRPSERMFLLHAVLLLCRAKKSRLLDWVTIAVFREHDTPREIPEYAYDKHTQKGRKMGRGTTHFFTEATRLEPYSPVDREEEYKTRAYEALQREKPERPRPEGLFPEDDYE